MTETDGWMDGRSRIPIDAYAECARVRLYGVAQGSELYETHTKDRVSTRIASRRIDAASSEIPPQVGSTPRVLIYR